MSVVAALYDVHGNLPALEAVLADDAFARADAVVVGGDVASGPMPAEVLDRLLALALPSKFQNATPVLIVNTEEKRIAVNTSLSCGAVATKMGGAGAFTIVTFKLTQRPGGDCGTGVGGTARGAIRVERRMIKEWYRLPDEPDGQQAAS